MIKNAQLMPPHTQPRSGMDSEPLSDPWETNRVPNPARAHHGWRRHATRPERSAAGSEHGKRIGKAFQHSQWTTVSPVPLNSPHGQLQSPVPFVPRTRCSPTFPADVLQAGTRGLDAEEPGDDRARRRAYGLRDEEYLHLKVLTCMLPAI